MEHLHHAEQVVRSLHRVGLYPAIDLPPLPKLLKLEGQRRVIDPEPRGSGGGGEEVRLGDVE